MNPYLSPFTIPDGSTRRPIVDRVPETRPRRENLVLGMRYPLEFPAWFVDSECTAQGRVWNSGDVWANERDDSALALCRVACEDWLEEVGILRVLKIKPLDKSKPRGYTADWEAWPAQSFESGFQSTRDAALVALAHALADAKGIAP